MSNTASANYIERGKKAWISSLNIKINIIEGLLNAKRRHYLNQKNEAEQKIACAKENTTIDSDVELEKVKLFEQEIKEIDDCLALMPGFRNSLQSITTMAEILDLRRAFREATMSIMRKKIIGEMVDDTTDEDEADVKEVERRVKEIVDRLGKNDRL